MINHIKITYNKANIEFLSFSIHPPDISYNQSSGMPYNLIIKNKVLWLSIEHSCSLS